MIYPFTVALALIVAFSPDALPLAEADAPLPVPPFDVPGAAVAPGASVVVAAALVVAAQGKYQRD